MHSLSFLELFLKQVPRYREGQLTQEDKEMQLARSEQIKTGVTFRKYLFMRTVVFSFIVFLGISSPAQVRLSEKSEIAIITIGPYQGEVWSAFGHSGIRVYDPENDIDWFYNYGLYDFEQENFLLNFCLGLLKYRVEASHYGGVVSFYKSQNRFIKAQHLNLTLEEKQQFFDALQNNVKPENAEYLYNYVYDNCATKLRDVTEGLFHGRIAFDLSYKEEGKTMRDLMDDYLGDQPWGDLGIDVGLGLQIDKEATAYEYMFLPDYIFNAFEGATIDQDSIKAPLLSRTEAVFLPQEEESKPDILTPLNIFILLFFLVGFITNRNFKIGKRTNWIDAVLFSLTGLTGWWVTFLWFGTEHLSKINLNILWAIPLHAPLALFISNKKLTTFMKIYFRVVACWYCMLLIAWPLLPQPLHTSLIPLVLAMILRAFYISYDLKGYTGWTKKCSK